MKKESKNKVKKIRLSIPLSEEIYKKIEEDAEVVGVSMATYAAMIIGNHYKTQQISLNYAKDNFIEAFRGIIEPIYKANGKDFDTEINKAVEESIEDTKKISSKIILNRSEK